MIFRLEHLSVAQLNDHISRDFDIQFNIDRELTLSHQCDKILMYITGCVLIELKQMYKHAVSSCNSYFYTSII